MNDSTAAKNCSPASNPFAVAIGCVIAILLAGVTSTGCKTIRDLRLTHEPSPALPAADAQQQLADGWALFEQLPRTLNRVTQAALLIEPAARNLPDQFDAQIKAATALAWLAEHAPEVPFRKQAAQHGIAIAKHARQLDPQRVEGHYWYALNVGLLADVDRDYGLSAVDEMVAALKIAIDLDPAYDHAGPLRLLGLLHLRAPAPPISVGSKRKAQQLFQRATEVQPQFPENYLYLAEAQRDLSRIDDARANLQKLLSLPVPAGYEEPAAHWHARARELLESLKK
jgi:tetratricopeptide (TPR) repeat protein